MGKLFVFVSVILLTSLLPGGGLTAQDDRSHYSGLFTTNRPYRIFLPAGYELSRERYPVVYFLHGNQGSHEFKLEGTRQLVDEGKFILVALSGRSIPSDNRPYNTGGHADVKYPVQFRDYFLEVMAHIDSAYRTLSDRAHRAVIGHSMGGFMAFVLAGEYPHLIGVAVNFKGSPEFFLGYPENHSLYSLRDLFKNHLGVKLRFHNSTVDELVHLNNEVNQGALREAGLDYDYRVYPGGHAYTPPEFRDAVAFVLDAFKKPNPVPDRWHHTSLYPDFNVWGFEVRSNLKEPGFIEMKGVTKGGMRVRTRTWEPDGRMIPGAQVTIKTAPIYTPSARYALFDFNETSGAKKVSEIASDADGRLSFSVNHESHQIGIYGKNDPPEIAVVEHKVNGNGTFLEHRKPCNLNVRLLNRGGSAVRKIKITLSSSTKGVTVANGVEHGGIQPGELTWLSSEFSVTASNEPPADGSPYLARLNLVITDDKGNSWKDEFDCPVFFDVPPFTKIGIADGDYGAVGHGNWNNKAEPGEVFMIYQGSHRTRLYYDDPCIDDEKLRVDLYPDKWGGDGFALTSMVRISKGCPRGHEIKLLASYEEKDWKTIKRNVTWGTIVIKVGTEPEYK